METSSVWGFSCKSKTLRDVLHYRPPAVYKNDLRTPTFLTERVTDDSSTDVIPGGSSSGSAVAVSANIVPLSFGTETDNSINGPASINGIVRIKASVGLTSRAGVIPISKNVDTVGSFGRTVGDAVHSLNAIVGTDERDPMTCSSSRL